MRSEWVWPVPVLELAGFWGFLGLSVSKSDSSERRAAGQEAHQDPLHSQAQELSHKDVSFKIRNSDISLAVLKSGSRSFWSVTLAKF